ncbi:aminopeptidase [Tepiditoga spiralis]|uniref:Aminopeptidase n=1 Tax=Tepiditoga spiralis TaxID=2108365 RepID=A0A7G1G5D6_9BACT|nr:aminopeptidase [Tepiditoga spiralis]BBE30244.1 aminopeptidase [Tepiditoga spiralis]
MENFKELLEKYAELSVRTAINIQKDQTLVVNAPIVAVDFVREVVKKAYENGAKNVHIEWHDEEITYTKYKMAPDEAFNEFPMWKAKGFEEFAKQNAAFLSISASNPDLLKDVDPQKIANANKAAAKAMNKFREYTQKGKVSWAVVSVPTKEWSKKVFGTTDEEKLWKKIFEVTRVNTEDPVSEWKKHIGTLKNKIAMMNSKNYKFLHYKAPGTDLKIELPEDHVWVGGGLTTEKGVYFIPNMPTEEIFTLPLKTGINGTVTSTKPLNYGGNLIEKFTLTFKDGKIIDFSAKNGYETLKKLIETDEGSHYIGEVALVPQNSPISNSNIIFYNTLFDENASCHLAIGAAYPLCLKNGPNMTRKELEEKGANTSMTHVDFMIGSDSMNIDGITKDGKIEPIFRNGNWIEE